MKKIMISIDEKVLERVDKFISDNGYNRSSFFTLCANEYISAKEQLPFVRDKFLEGLDELKTAINEKLK